MKITNSLLFTVVVLLCLACNNKQDSKVSIKESDKVEKTVKKATEVSKEKENIKNITDALKNKTPLSKTQLESWLPPSLIGLPQTSKTVNLLPDMSNGTAFYKADDKEIVLMVTDGAGEKRAVYIEPFITLNTENFNNEDKYGHEKTKTIYNIKLRETYQKINGGVYHVMIFYENRYAVKITAKKISHEALERVIKELNLEKLKKL